MKRVTGLLLASGILLAGCASGPTLSGMQSKLPSLAEEQGRVYFYREALLGFGSAIQPDIMVNGQKVGKCTSNGVFFVDWPPGNYHVSVTNEVERTLDFTLEKSEEKFVRCYLVPTFVSTGHAIVELVDPAKARKCAIWPISAKNSISTGRVDESCSGAIFGVRHA